MLWSKRGHLKTHRFNGNSETVQSLENGVIHPQIQKNVLICSDENTFVNPFVFVSASHDENGAGRSN